MVVVDDDIDPADMDEVIWAMCTRFEPREDIEILRGCWSTALDPMGYGDDDPRNARVVIDACKPFNRRDTFPIVVRTSKELEDQREIRRAAEGYLRSCPACAGHPRLSLQGETWMAGTSPAMTRDRKQ